MKCQLRGLAENPCGQSNMENAAQSPGCKADKSPGEGAYIKYVTEPGLTDNAAGGVFGRASRTLSLLFVFLLSTLSAAGCVQVPISGQWDFGVKELRVFKKARVGQDFYVSDRNLTRIDVFLYPSKARRAKMTARERRKVSNALKGKDVTLKLYSLPERRRVLKMDLAVNKIKTARMYAFTFKPLAGSKHRRYYFELEAPGLNREAAAGVRATTLDRYKEGSAFSGDQAMPSADLGFQTYIDMTAVILIHSIAARLAADVPFMAVWALLVLLTAAATLREWWPRSGQEPV